MTENKIKILEKLYKDGFVHQIDFDVKLKQLFSDLKHEDQNYIKQKEILLDQENQSKGYQIDYFTRVLKNRIDLEKIIQEYGKAIFD
ncbi:hypothetical protein ACSTS3_04720 [Aquimarina muelleri]|uniref:hypothetical protein n=1 Tax=Aquimarina muelleri TaxID=279356 RepID=UPI003F685432